jgi:hypothetical protein
MPAQGEIDELGGGKTVSDWENRFKLAYEKCKDENVPRCHKGEKRRIPLLVGQRTLLVCRQMISIDHRTQREEEANYATSAYGRYSW